MNFSNTQTNPTAHECHGTLSRLNNNRSVSLGFWGTLFRKKKQWFLQLFRAMVPWHSCAVRLAFIYWEGKTFSCWDVETYTGSHAETSHVGLLWHLHLKMLRHECITTTETFTGWHSHVKMLRHSHVEMLRHSHIDVSRCSALRYSQIDTGIHSQIQMLRFSHVDI